MRTRHPGWRQQQVRNPRRILRKVQLFDSEIGYGSRNYPSSYCKSPGTPPMGCGRHAKDTIARAPAAYESSRSIMDQRIHWRGAAIAPGRSAKAASRKKSSASSGAESRSLLPSEKLKAAAKSANPTKYTQSKRHGIHVGAISTSDCAPSKCCIPKAARAAAMNGRPRSHQRCNPGSPFER